MMVKRVLLSVLGASLPFGLYFGVPVSLDRTVAHATGMSLADTTQNIHLALDFNSDVPLVNNTKPAEDGVIDYVFGADGKGYFQNYPGGRAWHEYYLPWPQAAENHTDTTSWFQANHPGSCTRMTALPWRTGEQITITSRIQPSTTPTRPYNSGL